MTTIFSDYLIESDNIDVDRWNSYSIADQTRMSQNQNSKYYRQPVKKTENAPAKDDEKSSKNAATDSKESVTTSHNSAENSNTSSGKYSKLSPKTRATIVKVTKGMSKVTEMSFAALEQPAAAALAEQAFERISHRFSDDADNVEEFIEHDEKAVVASLAITSDDVIKESSTVRKALKSAFEKGMHEIQHVVKEESDVYKTAMKSILKIAKKEKLTASEKSAVKKLGVQIATATVVTLLAPFAHAATTVGIGTHALTSGTIEISKGGASSFLHSLVTESVRSSLYEISGAALVRGTMTSAYHLFKTLREDESSTDDMYLNAFMEVLSRNIETAKLDQTSMLSKMLKAQKLLPDDEKIKPDAKKESVQLKYTDFLRECTNVMTTMYNPLTKQVIHTLSVNVPLYESKGHKVIVESDRDEMRQAMLSSGDYNSLADIEAELDSIFNSYDVVDTDDIPLYTKRK